MARLRLDRLAFLGPNREPAAVRLDPKLTVICGASDTGKSFFVESMDFALGRSTPPRDVPQRVGYDRLRLQLGTSDRDNTWTLQRSLSGGGFQLSEGEVADSEPMRDDGTLGEKHKHSTTDNISGWLLDKIDLLGSRVQKNRAGETNSLSFRYLNKLILVDETDIIAQRSPFLSGQYTTSTVEFAVLKLLLTGVDDSALVNTRKTKEVEQDVASKLEFIEAMIARLESEIEDIADEGDLRDQLERLNDSINGLAERVAAARQDANQALQRRQELARSLEQNSDRFDEITELLERFSLLGFHYRTDVERLQAMQEGGSLFVHMDVAACPLCGALPTEQRHDSGCDADVPSIVKAAEAEVMKIEVLAGELDETTTSLRAERARLEIALAAQREQLRGLQAELDQILTPNLDEAFGRFREIADLKAIVSEQLQQYRRLAELNAQRDQLLFVSEADNSNAVQADLSQAVMDDFAQEVQLALSAWNFPGADRVHFDFGTKDFVIDGKPRASFGKGFRAITHAAVTLSLMRFCLDRVRPHPGFVVLDSPLLSYWKPEGVTDSLAGSDLKERFYEYLFAGEARGQVIIVENEHPSIAGVDTVVFTRNPQDGRYGLFPPTAS